MEDFYFQCIYDILQNSQWRLESVADVSMLKAMRMEGAKVCLDDRADLDN
jgi:hypothetical protein